MNIFQDAPITSINYDSFRRDTLVNLIANSINKTISQNHPCVVYGIYGKWGEGKTSFINFIDEKICKNTQIKVVHFNPWMINGQEALLAEFFRCLASDGINTVKDLILKYGRLLSFVTNLFTLKYGNDISAIVGNTVNLAIDTFFHLKSLYIN